MGSEVKDEAKVVLTPPPSLAKGSADVYKAPNLLKRLLSLFTNVRPGSDLTSFQMQLPPLFNLPKSQLQSYGETVYCIADDMLGRCANGESALERLISVVAWNISTLHPLVFGMAPFNSILGETHHVSRGTLNVLLEQVSHHPPVMALHATDEKENVEMVWCQQPIPRFHGTSIEVEVLGKRSLKLLNHGENYIMNPPKLLVRLFPRPGFHWVGKIRIRCEESGLEAELCFRGNSFLRFGGNNRYVMGKIFHSSSSSKIICEINGHWDRTVTVKDVEKGKITVIYDGNEALSTLKTPIVKDPTGVWASESALVWSEASRSILNKDWEKAREAKKAVEEKQRELARERKSKEENWVPNHFNVSFTKEGGWDCSPKQKWVPPAPIVIPL